jgi:hypothetical protein
MSALLSWPAVRRWPLLFVLFLLTAPAFANSITIGSLTFLGTSDATSPHKPMFLLELNTQGVTFDSYAPEWPYPLFFEAQVFGWDAGVFTTMPPPFAPPIIPPHFCPCEAVVFTMTLLNPGLFRLANGQLFDPNTTITLILEPPPGQTYLQYEQTFSIVLTSVPEPVPEPGTLLLFASGLLGLARVVRSKLAG